MGVGFGEGGTKFSRNSNELIQTGGRSESLRAASNGRVYLNLQCGECHHSSDSTILCRLFKGTISALVIIGKTTFSYIFEILVLCRHVMLDHHLTQ